MIDSLVSVLVPVYNAEKFLRQCIDSIANQTYSNLQVVLINDGSTDSSEHICRYYTNRYSFIETYTQTNSGVSTTRNRLLEKAKGDYFLFVDSDDWIEPEMIEYLLNKAQDNNADVVTCEKCTEGDIYPIKYEEKHWDHENAVQRFLFHKELNGSLWNKLIRKTISDDVAFDSRISYGEDALFFWNCLKKAKSIVKTNKQLYHYRKNSESISRKDWTPSHKGTGHMVWANICRDVEKNYPQYVEIAYARFALEDMWALYFASLCGYKYDEHIAVRQENIRRHLGELLKYPIDGLSKTATAFVLAHCYKVGKLIRFFRS